MKTNKNYLKLKSVQKSDTGVFICRGVNGFGSVKVRVELVVTGGFGMSSGLQKDLNYMHLSGTFLMYH